MQQEGVPCGHSLFSFSLTDSAQGKGLPYVARCAGPRPTRPYGLRAVTLPTLCGGGAAARPATALQAVPGNVRPKAGPLRVPARSSWAAPLLGGTLPRRKAKHLRCALRAALPRSSPSPVAA